jgi:LmbE family N-acetylglucosaminyl deacetylase
MCVLAHPDDESLGVGGTLAKYAASGVSLHIVTATRGQRGWAHADEYPGEVALGLLREAELKAAASVLGVHSVRILDFMDGELDQADHKAVRLQIVRHIRTFRPHVVITFGPDGAYGHPDHIAISQFTTAALVSAADACYDPDADLPSHRVSKLYYYVASEDLLRRYEAVFGTLTMRVDGAVRGAVAWPPWQITTQIDATAHWSTVWAAVQCHRTQLPAYQGLLRLTPMDHQHLWGRQNFYRAFSLVNGGRAKEDDLFEGLP